jgi:hypothetical protein
MTDETPEEAAARRRFTQNINPDPISALAKTPPPDPTTPALLRYNITGPDWEITEDPDGDYVIYEDIAAQQPDERVAGLVEALQLIVGRWDRAEIKWEPDRPHWHSIHQQGYDRLDDAINRARSLLAQTTAAGGDSDA